MRNKVNRITAMLPATLVTFEYLGFLHNSGSAKGPATAVAIKKTQRLSITLTLSLFGVFDWLRGVKLSIIESRRTLEVG